MNHTPSRNFLTFQEAAGAGPYDELPMFPAGIDPQIHMSRNDRPQPFWLVLEKDSVLVLMSGVARVEMRDSPVLWEDLIPGDFLYVPAGTPHRISPAEPSVMHRFKAENAGLEGVQWFCDQCDSSLYRRVWDTARQTPQAGYLQSCTEFNQSEPLRRCSNCTRVHPLIDLGAYRWADIDAQLAKVD